MDTIAAPNGKSVFCGFVVKAKMPLLEQFCGRSGLKDWVLGFQPNVWEYAHQRSPVWERPDGRLGLEMPGLDYLVALRMLD